MDYETLVANLLAGSKPRRQTVGSREFLIVPLSMLVPGVLNGSQGPLYYSDEETKASAPLWDGMPMTLYHPTGTDGASLLSVRNKKGTLDPVIWDRQGIGYVRNPRFENSKLRAEGWFDVARVRQLDEHFSKTRYGYVPVLPRLESGEPVELSTGLFTANRRVKNGYDYKTNRPYIAEAHSYRPDHLAILPDVRGACSIEDGCGVHVANTFCPTGEGGGVDPTCSSKGEKQGKLQSFINRLFGKGAHSSYVSEAEHREREKNYRRLSLAYDSLAMNDSQVLAGIHNHACCPSCKAGKPCEGEENERLGRDALRQKVEEGHNPPNWAVNEAKWEKAKARAKVQGHEEDWAYVVAIYKKMGGTIKGEKMAQNAFLTWIENAWSDEARAAAIEARRAKSSARGVKGKLSNLLERLPTHPFIIKPEALRGEHSKRANEAAEKGDHSTAAQMHGELAGYYKGRTERLKARGAHEEDVEESKKLHEIHKKAYEEHAEKARKKRATHNAFCATGEGGGIDPSCSPKMTKKGHVTTPGNRGNKFQREAESTTTRVPKGEGPAFGSRGNTHQRRFEASHLSTVAETRSREAGLTSPGTRGNVHQRENERRSHVGASEAARLAEKGDHAGAAQHHEETAAEHEAEATRLRSTKPAKKPGFFGRHSEIGKLVYSYTSGNRKRERMAAAHDKAAAAHRRAAQAHRSNVHNLLNGGGTGMKLTANQRSGIVQFLCNSEPWKSKQGSQVFLSQLDDETLQSLGAQAKGVQEAQRLVGNQVVDVDDDDEDEDEEEPGSVRNQYTEDELDEFSKQMFGQPASVVRQIVGNANKINQREKKQLIGRLVVNLQGDARERMAKRLAKKDAEELRDMLAMLQPTHNSFLDQPEDDLGLLARSFGVQGGGSGAGEETTLNFAGAGASGGQTFKDDADNVLPWGTVSFNDLASPALRKTS